MRNALHLGMPSLSTMIGEFPLDLAFKGIILNANTSGTHLLKQLPLGLGHGTDSRDEEAVRKGS